MNQEQMNVAMEEMAGWLSHPQELGRKPEEIECAGEFDLYDLHYYIFKYKKNKAGKWLLGVCGGYEGDGLECCGHVYSEMQEYDESCAKEDAVKIVEMIRSYWMERAKESENRKEHAGTFACFVLLEENKWDKEEFVKILNDEWQVIDDGEMDEKENEENDDNILVMSYNGNIISVGLMPAPVPDEEAEYHAASNYRWKGAGEAARKHKAHLVVAVMGLEKSPTESGELLVKVVAACCRQGNVLGIYANGTVYQPEFYVEFAEMMKQGMFPIYNLVWFGLYGSENGISGYTNGMNLFGYDEIEVIDSSADPEDLVSFMTDIAIYVIQEDVTLNDGETIGFTAEQKLPITKSKGVAVDGETLKIGF